ncbi:MAG TPA: amidohydrolase family protein, partial [Pseudonocardiaceae bacterium]|nr:amidohydrolase family protein [Pseudonocardiaceae bacterium]
SGLAVLAEPGWQRSSSSAELAAWLGLLESELADGALGIGILMGYAPRTDPKEFLAVARLAASANAPTYTHVRELVEADPSTPIDGSEEIVAAAAETGAAMHHCHVNSTSRRHVDRVLALLDRSRAAGSRVTVEAYPYGAGSTGVGAFFLAPERLPAWGLTPSNIVMIATGERVASADRLAELRATSPEAECLVEFLDERDPADRALLHRPLAFPDAVVASDAMPVIWPDGRRDTREWPLPPGAATHPRTSGTFAKSLRLMVRESGTWSWPEAFRRCAYLPARILDQIAPAARGKGWLGAGSDADIVVLDPETIGDTATYADPARPSVGVRHLVVNGEFVVHDGALLADAYPGRPLRGRPA